MSGPLLALPRIGLPANVILPRPWWMAGPAPSHRPKRRVLDSCHCPSCRAWSDFTQVRTSFDSCTVSHPDNCDESLRFRSREDSVDRDRGVNRMVLDQVEWCWQLLVGVGSDIRTASPQTSATQACVCLYTHKQGTSSL